MAKCILGFKHTPILCCYLLKTLYLVEIEIINETKFQHKNKVEIHLFSKYAYSIEVLSHLQSLPPD